MARGAAQQAQRKQQRPKQTGKPKNTAPSWEEQLFFSRLRRHAKIIYVLLAVVFAAGFVVLGVGSGSTGIGDLLQGKLFGSNGGTSTGSQISDKQKAIARNPNNAALYVDLASLYQSDQNQAKALATLQQAKKIAPKNVAVLNQIAAIYGARAGNDVNAYQNLQATYAENVTTPPGLDTSSQIGQALTSDPYSQALQTKLSTAYSKALSSLTKVESVYKNAAQVSRGTSDEPNQLLQLASAAQNANDLPTAANAYKRFLQVSPDNPNAPTVRQTLAQIQAALPKQQR
jgi:cytochrome c-type biogenesis protein CcmH/NrfG